ncbi:MAG: hypothetical protein LBD27_02955 [Tannerella sp.]|jgi:hypothetical protein|nr:hypothetical protein [Tannerella sp.]
MNNPITEVSQDNNSKEWLEALFLQIEELFLYDKPVRCKIYSITPKGFIVKINGIFAFISRKQMPWKYLRPEYWQAIAPTLAGKVFFCKITETIRLAEHKYSIYADASIHKFPPVEIFEATPYLAIVLFKLGKTVFLDLGYHFGWKNGSIPGVLLRKRFASAQMFENCEAGQILQVYCAGLEDEQLDCIEANYYEASKMWDPQTLDPYVGKIVSVHVKRSENETTLLVENLYRGQLRAKDLQRVEASGLPVVRCKVRIIDYIQRRIILRPIPVPFPASEQDDTVLIETLAVPKAPRPRQIEQLIDPKTVERLHILTGNRPTEEDAAACVLPEQDF